MLTLAAVAIFPIAVVSYVIVRDETRNVTRNVEFATQAAAQSAQARSPGCSTGASCARSRRPRRRSCRRRSAVATGRSSSGSPAVAASWSWSEAGRYGRRFRPAFPTRAQLVSHGRPIGSVIALLPMSSALPKRLSAGAAPGVRLTYVDLKTPAPPGTTHGSTLPLGAKVGIRAYIPDSIVSHRQNAAYIRVIEAGLLALVALMLLTLVLARPLLRAFRWTEEQANEARIDSLTGLANRRALEEILAAEISRAHRFAHQLAVVLLDLDRFKEINDSFGHAAGDVMLRAVSRLLTSLARQGDTVARWGGEEFVVVLPETDLAGARRFAERLRRTIEAHVVDEMKTSASCGVATMLPEDTVEELLGAADQALYQAKSNGRNRTESAMRGPRPAAA